MVPGTLGCTLYEVHLGRSTKSSTMLKNSTEALDIATTAGQSSGGLPKALTLPLVWILLMLSSYKNHRRRQQREMVVVTQYLPASDMVFKAGSQP